jgi:TolC family type I secretion outer membrane protein
MKNKLITFFITALVSTSAFSMDLNEALTHAYKNNPALKLKREEYLRAIEQYPQALSEFMPRVNGQLKYSKNQSKDTDPLAYGSNDPRKSIGKGIDKSVSVTQPLFNGGGSVAGLQAAKLAYLAAKSQLEVDEQEILSKAIDSYLTYIQAQENYDVADKSVKAFLKQYEATQQKYKLGESTKTEVAQAKAALAQAKSGKAVAFARLQAQKADFKRNIGVEPVNVKLPSIPGNLPNNFDTLLSQSKTTHPYINAAKYNVEASKYSTYKSKSQLLPSADLGLSVNNSANKYKTKGSSSIRHKDSVSKGGAITIHIPILAKGGAEYSQIREQKSKARSAALSLESVIDAIVTECISTWENHIAAKEKINLVKDQIDAASLALEGIKQEEALGNRTVLDVLNAQNELYKAQISSIEAKKDHILIAYKLQSLLGNLTAQAMKLKVDQFNAEQEFNKVKHKLIGY